MRHPSPPPPPGKGRSGLTFSQFSLKILRCFFIVPSCHSDPAFCFLNCPLTFLLYFSNPSENLGKILQFPIKHSQVTERIFVSVFSFSSSSISSNQIREKDIRRRRDQQYKFDIFPCTIYILAG